jgi:hypothetical protein
MEKPKYSLPPSLFFGSSQTCALIFLKEIKSELELAPCSYNECVRINILQAERIKQINVLIY